MSITPFEYSGQQVRVAELDDELWWIAADLCAVLDLGNPTQALTRIDADERTLISNEGRQANAVNESGMYALILGSRKPEAKAFKRWVTHEVLPAIRKTGAYGAPQWTGPELLARAVLEAAETIKSLEAAAPKIHAWDGLVSGAGDYTITDAAKVLSRSGVQTGPRKLHQQLLSLGWIYKNQRDKWTAHQRRLNDGCLTERARYYIDDDGVSTLATPQVRVTAKGLERLRDALSPQRALVAGGAA